MFREKVPPYINKGAPIAPDAVLPGIEGHYPFVESTSTPTLPGDPLVSETGVEGIVGIVSDKEPALIDDHLHSTGTGTAT